MAGNLDQIVEQLPHWPTVPEAAELVKKLWKKMGALLPLHGYGCGCWSLLRLPNLSKRRLN